jgi:UDP-N-acetylglucosamine 2-epimerase (non-hydrolysing)
MHNLKKLKIITIIGTRPELIRLSILIPKLDLFFDHFLVHTGQNYDYELNEIFFNDLNIRKPDIFLECATGSVANTIAEVIKKSDEIFAKTNPDAVLILGDTNSSLAAITAKRRKIPIFHMEAGNRCFDMRVPEEINRKIVDHIADINLPYSDVAKENLIREGINPDLIIKTGSPLFEVLQNYNDKIEKSTVFKELNLEKNNYFLISCHRQENIDSDKNINLFNSIINKLEQNFKIPIIISTHPRTNKKLNNLKLKFNKNVILCKPFSFTDYIYLQKNAFIVLSDSGSITEESSILNFPAINIREAHERQEGMEEGAVMFTGMDYDNILQAINILRTQKKGENRTVSIVNDYYTPNFSEKIIRIITSYTQYVNRKIWQK